MATWTNINTPSLVSAAAPTTNAITATTDQFAAEFGAKYLVRFTNAGATPSEVRVVDPTTVAPAGRAFANAYAVAGTVTNAQSRSIVVDAARFRNSSGNIVFEYSVSMVNAASLAEVYRLP